MAVEELYVVPQMPNRGAKKKKMTHKIEKYLNLIASHRFMGGRRELLLYWEQNFCVTFILRSPSQRSGLGFFKFNSVFSSANRLWVGVSKI